MPSDHDLFVYGTLMRGLHNQPFLDGCTYLGPARARGRLVDLGPYPGLVRDRERWVSGEWYRIPVDLVEATLARLDALEGYTGRAQDPNNLYVRGRVELEHFGGVRHATTYFWAGEVRADPVIASSSWRSRNVPVTGQPLVDALAQLRADVAGLPTDVVVDFDPYRRGEVTWRGAELCVRDGAPLNPPRHPFGRVDYGDVDAVTPHARAAAWLTFRLRDEVQEHLNLDKYAFFGAIGLAIKGHHAMYGWSSPRATLELVLSAVEHLGRQHPETCNQLEN